jgi:hypothetical protein
VPYTDAFIEQCFLAWYKNDKPKGMRLREVLPADEMGRTPEVVLVNKWKRDRQWDERADEMDLQVQRQLEITAVQERVEMFKRHAVAAREIQDKGLKYLQEHDFDSAASAIRGIVEGVRIERDSVGIPDALLKMAAMNNEQLEKTVNALLSRVSVSETDDKEEVLEGEFQEETEKEENTEEDV